MRSIFLLLTILLIALFAINCGGGGGSSQSVVILRQDPIEVGAGQHFTDTFGDVVIDIPSGTYPNGASLTLTQYTTAPFKPGNPNFKPMHAALELSANATAQAEISVSVPSDPTGYVVGVKTEDSWQALRTLVANGQLTFNLSNQLSQAPAHRSPSGGLWQIVVGIAKDNKQDTVFALNLVDGSGSFGDGSAIIVHGLLDNYASMKTMAKNLRSRYGWRNVYSLAYPWSMPCPETAEYLGSVLDDPTLSPKSVTLVGHSRGCDVIRYTLEKLNKTMPVKEAIYFNGAHQGARAATTFDILLDIFTLWLNDKSDGSPLGVGGNDAFLEELRPDSQFRTDLNSYDFDQRGYVDYIFIAGEKDKLVTVDSALASGVDMQELTGGSVLRYTMPTLTHFNIKNSSDQIDQFFSLLGPRVDAFQIWAEPNPVAGQNDGWHFVVNIRNISSQPVAVDNLTMDQHRQDGWWYAVQWCDPTTPGGELFPDRYFRWGRTLQPGEVVQLNVWWWTNGNHDPLSSLPPLFQARTAVLTVQAEQPVGYHINQASTKVVAYYQDLFPEEPQTRRPGQMPDGQIGKMGSGK
ncbi:MAG: hypothetical protein WD970_01040 [Patescibacteria group bacterium]